MSRERNVSLNGLKQLLHSGVPDPVLLQVLLSAVDSISQHDAMFRSAESAELIRTYTRRLSPGRALPEGFMITEGFLSKLESVGDKVFGFTIEHGKRATTIFLDGNTDVLVGAVSGPDNRATDD